ncbi:hypothetical protein RHSIM_Rhsim10G0195700 [Rhododendron simsii]|uniref:Aldehyde dehydrogenase domain-containing protein n=1 Tax=Rhododendron simsii TaxID=118357 RepID=A0A834GB27_RHOSS|nr:hypothetical protein RHSIM_Rhsim10G0195700 [Rhododendron simsii]
MSLVAFCGLRELTQVVSGPPDLGPNYTVDNHTFLMRLTKDERLQSYPHVANTLLSLYTKLKDLTSVKRVFDNIENPDVYSWTTLLSACTKLGQVGYACEVFEKMPHRSVAVWNAIVTGCAENGYSDVALDMFRRMHLLGVRHDNYTFASVLSLCSLELIDFGRQVHSMVIKTGFLGRASVINAQLTMYFGCGNVNDAYEVFEEAEGLRDEITYNAMIGGLASMGRDKDALIMFVEMQNVCLRPTELTFVSLISSCSCARVGHQIHAQAIMMGFEMCTSVSNAAVTMYSSCGDLNVARMVFERLDGKDIVSWNAMITCYAQGNLGGAATLAYVKMQREGTQPDEFTIGSLLASSESKEIVEMIQSLVIRNGLIFKIEVSNAFISAFSKHGYMKQAYEVFSDMSPRNLISWNTVIYGFQLNGFAVRGLEQFSLLLLSRLRPNVYTLSIVLSICASVSSLRHGKQVHGYIIKQGLFSEALLANALISMYAKSGVLDLCLRVFNSMSIINKDIVSWNSLISAYARHGEGKRAVRCFEAMLDSGGVQPDQATFTSVLSACSHSGLVDDGTRIFNSMVRNYGFQPGVDHFSCMVDLLGRAGYLDEAERLLNGKHIELDSNTWWTLFSSCAAHGNLRLGRTVAGFLLQKEQNNPAVYVQLSNIYANAGQWEEAANLREMMKSHGRAELLHKAAALLKEHKAPTAECLVKEIAKPAKDSVTEVVRSGDLVSYCAEEGVRILGEGKFLVSDSFPGNERTKYCLTSKVNGSFRIRRDYWRPDTLLLPLQCPSLSHFQWIGEMGFGRDCPWGCAGHSTLQLSCQPCCLQIAPAIIAGNSLVLKLPTQPLESDHSHLNFPRGCCGVPSYGSLLPLGLGLIGCITGFIISLCCFTGGDTGVAISKNVGMVPLQMELGGKDACIVLEDADLDLVAANIIKEVSPTVNAKVAKLTVGLPEENCDITPVVTESSANFIEGLVMDAKKKGATFCQEYKRDGNLIWPLLLDNVHPDMRIAWEEPFGPVLPVIRINTDEEGIHHCNASNFGLQGCVFTRDINKAILISDAMESGTIQINSAPALGPDHFPFHVTYNSLETWFEGQWNWITMGHQEHKPDDQGEDHCDQLANSFLRLGLIPPLTSTAE